MLNTLFSYVTQILVYITLQYVTRPGKPVLSAHQLDSTFRLYVQATLMHYPEIPKT